MIQHSNFKKRFIVGAAFASLFLYGGYAQAEGELYIYNWAEYIGDYTIENFETEFDVTVTYDNYDSVETADAKLMAGNSGYDIVSHSGSAAGRLIAAGLIRELDTSRLPNMKHMNQVVLDQVAKNWDPNNNHFVPYMWGTHGVTYNEEYVRSVFPDAPIGSMDLIFKPENMEKLAQCGVAFLDSPTDIIPMALAYLGLDPSSTNAADYKAAEEMLKKVRPFIKTFDNYAYARLPEKEFCVAVTWGPDGLFATFAAEEAETGQVLDFFLPEGEGKANIWVDGWIVPADAKNIENVYLFLDYVMRPEVAADDTNTTYYATANADAIDMVDPSISESESVYPSPESVAQMYPLKVVPPKIQRIRTRTWTNFVNYKGGG